MFYIIQHLSEEAFVTSHLLSYSWHSCCTCQKSYEENMTALKYEAAVSGLMTVCESDPATQALADKKRAASTTS